nr:hypothetical protein [Planctomycetota bacterium]
MVDPAPAYHTADPAVAPVDFVRRLPAAAEVGPRASRQPHRWDGWTGTVATFVLLDAAVLVAVVMIAATCGTGEH